MKKLITCALIAGLFAGALAVDASAARRPRRVQKVVTLKYTGGEMGVTSPAASASFCLRDESLPFACKALPSPGAKFKYIKIKVIDASGQKVGGFIAHDGVDADGDGFDDAYGNFCGAHRKPIRLRAPGAPVGISLTMGFCKNGTPSIVTHGTVKAIFSNLP